MLNIIVYCLISLWCSYSIVLVTVADPERGVGGGGGGILIIDRGDVEAGYEPKNKKGVHGKTFQIEMLSDGISCNYFESKPKNRDNEYS